MIAGVLFILIASMLCFALVYAWGDGFQGRRLHVLTLILLAPTLLTVLSAAGTAGSIGDVAPALLNLGVGLPVAVIGLVLAWVALTTLYWLPADGKMDW